MVASLGRRHQGQGQRLQPGRREHSANAARNLSQCVAQAVLRRKAFESIALHVTQWACAIKVIGLIKQNGRAALNRWIDHPLMRRRIAANLYQAGRGRKALGAARF